VDQSQQVYKSQNPPLAFQVRKQRRKTGKIQKKGLASLGNLCYSLREPNYCGYLPLVVRKMFLIRARVKKPTKARETASP